MGGAKGCRSVVQLVRVRYVSNGKNAAGLLAKYEHANSFNSAPLHRNSVAQVKTCGLRHQHKCLPIVQSLLLRYASVVCLVS